MAGPRSRAHKSASCYLQLSLQQQAVMVGYAARCCKNKLLFEHWRCNMENWEHAHRHTHTDMHTHPHTCTHTHTHTQGHTHADTHTHTCLHTHTCTFARPAPHMRKRANPNRHVLAARGCLGPTGGLRLVSTSRLAWASQARCQQSARCGQPWTASHLQCPCTSRLLSRRPSGRPGKHQFLQAHTGAPASNSGHGSAQCGLCLLSGFS